MKLKLAHRILLSLAAAVAVSACKSEPKTETGPAKPSTPTAAAGSQPSGAQPTAGAGSQPAADSGPEAAPITGTVQLDGSLPATTLKPSDVLFVMARQSLNGHPGMLMATVRVQGPALPQEFELSSKNVMMPGSKFTGPFLVTARLDRDGDPLTKDDQDLYASASGELKGGEKGVALVLRPGQPPEAPKPTGAAPMAPTGAASQPAAR